MQTIIGIFAVIIAIPMVLNLKFRVSRDVPDNPGLAHRLPPRLLKRLFALLLFSVGLSFLV